MSAKAGVSRFVPRGRWRAGSGRRGGARARGRLLLRRGRGGGGGGSKPPPADAEAAPPDAKVVELVVPAPEAASHEARPQALDVGLTLIS